MGVFGKGTMMTEEFIMHVLSEDLPKILAPVAEAALSPLLVRVDRALDIVQSAVVGFRELLVLARESSADLKLILASVQSSTTRIS